MTAMNLPFAASGPRRVPTSGELSGGFPCGPLDQELFNFLHWWTGGQIDRAIEAAGLTTDDADLTQLPKAIRSQAMNYRVAGGTANALTATLDPAPSSWAEINGAPLRLRIATSNSGAATLNVNGLGAKNVRTLAGDALISGDLIAGSIMEFIYDQTSDTVLVINLQKGIGPYAIGSIYKITSSQTWTRPAGCRAILVEGIGGGGGGGGSQNSTAGNLSQGGGGGAGGYFLKLIINPDPSYNVTIGAGGSSAVNSNGNSGGTTSWGSVASATGGSGGSVLGNGSSLNASSCGSGGSGTGGDINGNGSPGQRGVRLSGSTGYAGNGAPSALGGGGLGLGTNGGGSTANASGYGAGGGGALASIGANGYPGGDGSPGIIKVWEFY